MKQILDNVISENQIWDLHIHTCECPKGTSEFSSLTCENYISKLIEIIKNYPLLKMISFTDHNYISTNVYKEFLNRKTDITLIVGIEVDVFLEEKSRETNDFKHLIFYFDSDKFDIDKDSIKINTFLETQPVILHEFLNFLISEIQVPFLISPHFMKQDKRSINYNWDEENTRKNLFKYIDQMCCFWETSNNSNIQNAIKFLEDFDCDNKVSVISFSDSNNFTKLENYLKNPNQYFSALPNFNGIRMVGSDCRRISFAHQELKDVDKGKYIGYVIQGTNKICFCNKLNSIIGGRGSGKSILLDGIAFNLNNVISRERLKEDRIEFIQKQDFKVYDMNNNELLNHNFQFDYFDQGYVYELFNQKDDTSIVSYFNDEFTKLDEFNVDDTRALIRESICIEKKKNNIVSDNVVALISKITLTSTDDIDKIPKNKKISFVEYIDSKSAKDLLNKPAIMPSVLVDNKEIKDKKKRAN